MKFSKPKRAGPQAAVLPALETSTMRLLGARALPGGWTLEAWAYRTMFGQKTRMHWFLMATRKDKQGRSLFRHTCRSKKALQEVYLCNWPMGELKGWVACTPNGSFNSAQYPEYRMQEARLNYQQRKGN